MAKLKHPFGLSNDCRFEVLSNANVKNRPLTIDYDIIKHSNRVIR